MTGYGTTYIRIVPVLYGKEARKFLANALKIKNNPDSQIIGRGRILTEKQEEAVGLVGKAFAGA